jgi:hypothetical protein
LFLICKMHVNGNDAISCIFLGHLPILVKSYHALSCMLNPMNSKP